MSPETDRVLSQRSTLLGAGGSKSRSRQANGANSRSLENVLASPERPDGASGNRKFESISLQRGAGAKPAFRGRIPPISLVVSPKIGRSMRRLQTVIRTIMANRSQRHGSRFCRQFVSRIQPGYWPRLANPIAPFFGESSAATEHIAAFAPSVGARTLLPRSPNRSSPTRTGCASRPTTRHFT